MVPSSGSFHPAFIGTSPPISAASPVGKPVWFIAPLILSGASSITAASANRAATTMPLTMRPIMSVFFDVLAM